ncbi:MAG TPA: rod shape-determining protein MreC [Acetobacteraceae bacterium]|nr:rod shape-determining protein MreC [Acetobacteraceae bacterium]
MLRLSIQTRQALAKLTLPVLVATSFGLMLLGKADAVLADRARMALADALVPIYAELAQPLASVRSAVSEVQDLWSLRAENARLRAENEQLRRWQSIALSLDAQNRELKANLHWMPQPAPSFVTVPVVADAGGEYAKAVLLAVGPHHGVHPGEIALDATGLVGRVTEVGKRTARVLLITDMNSRIPVMLENSHAHAILVGTNGPYPRLVFYPEGSPPQEGERVVTTAEAKVFPANLPVGTVRHTASGTPEVVPDAHLNRLEMVRLFDYGLTGIVPPETARVAERQH